MKRKQEPINGFLTKINNSTQIMDRIQFYSPKPRFEDYWFSLNFNESKFNYCYT